MMINYLLFFLIINHRIDNINSVTYVSLEIDNVESDEQEEFENKKAAYRLEDLEHENPPEPPTKPNYEAPGQWAKPPLNKNISLDFIPSKTYTQVRGRHIIKRLPRYHALLDATTDEEKDSAKRLRAVVSKKKVNTVYTEEGYEDAAYDHGAHERDADFHEDYARNLKNLAVSHETNPFYSSKTEDNDEYYEDNMQQPLVREPEKNNKNIKEKNKDFNSKNISREVWAEARMYPKYLVAEEVSKLEKGLENNAGMPAGRPEISAPNNLVDRSNDDSKYTNENVARLEGIRPKLRNITRKVFPKNEDTIESSTSSIPVTINYGNIFWEFFKTEMPKKISSIEVTTEPRFLTFNNTVKSFFQSSEEFSEIITNPTNLKVYETWKLGDIDKKNDESFSQNQVTEHSPLEIAEKVKKREMDSSKEYSISEKTTAAPIQPRFKLRNLISKTTNLTEYPELHSQLSIKNPTSTDIPELKSEAVIDTTIRSANEQTLSQNVKKPEYTLLTRSPSKSCNDLNNETKFNSLKILENGVLPLLTNHIDPAMINNELINNISVIKPPVMPPLGRITYADFLQDTYRRLDNPCLMQESLPRKKINETLTNKKSPIFVKYYLPRPRYYRYRQLLPFLSFMKENPKKSKSYEEVELSKMLPPSPLSRSQYVEFSTVKRHERDLLHDDLSSGIFTYSKPLLPVNRDVTTHIERSPLVDNRKIQSNSNGKLTKLLLNQRMSVRSNGLRKKRKSNDFFDDAPSVINSIINREIESRFPDRTSIDKDTSEESKNKQQDRVIKTTVPRIDLLKDITNNKKLIALHEIENKFLNNKKYPFYNDERVAGISTLKYISNPLQVPNKTHGGMEFYHSRDEYLKCDNVNPDLSQVTPEKVEEMEAKNASKLEQVRQLDLPRLHGLGEKLSCFKAKYFDKKPLDNPLFIEKQVDVWKPSDEFDLQQFKSSIPGISSKSSARVYHRVSKKPEITDLRQSESKNNQTVNQSAESSTLLRKKQLVRRKHPATTNSIIPYKEKVYDDVMETIKNLTTNKQDSFEIADLKPPLLFWKYKIIPHENKKFIHRMRPRVARELFKTIRIRKRSIDLDKNLKSPQKPVYTVNDRIRFSRPRDFVRYDKFTTEMTSTIKTRRKEPRYLNPNEKTEDTQLDTTYFEKPLDSTTAIIEAATSTGATTIDTKIREPHVRGKIGEMTELPGVSNIKKYSDFSEIPNAPYEKNNNKQEEIKKEEEEEVENQSEQVEKPTEMDTDDASETSVEYYSDEEKNIGTMSDTEENFERFSDRPLSPAINFYDPKYANLGPRINKPAFYHPPFNSPKYELNRGTNYKSHEDEDERESGLSSKYVFPWAKIEGKNSEESRERAYYLGRHKYPWQSREKLANEKGKNMKSKNNHYYSINNDSDEDQLSSETGLNFRILYPLERWRSLYEENYAKKRFKSSEIFDSDEESSEKKISNFNGKYHKSESKIPGADVEDIAKSIINFLNSNLNETIEDENYMLTTVTPQIPPTSATLAQNEQTTTPISEITTQRERPIYTVKPRHFPNNIIMEKFKRTKGPVVSESSTFQITSRPNIFKLMRKSPQSINLKTKKSHSESAIPKGRSRSRIRTTTTTTTFSTRAMHTPRLKNPNNAQRRRKLPNFKLAISTTPSTIVIEHQPKLSTGQRITQSLFPISDTSNNNKNFHNRKKAIPVTEQVEKLFMKTQQTTGHIHRAGESDEETSYFDNDTSINVSTMENNSQRPISKEIQPPIKDESISENSNIPNPYVLANLLQRQSPFVTIWINGNGKKAEKDGSNSDMQKLKVKYIKEPDQRLYTYVEDVSK